MEKSLDGKVGDSQNELVYKLKMEDFQRKLLYLEGKIQEIENLKKSIKELKEMFERKENKQEKTSLVEQKLSEQKSLLRGKEM